MSSLRSAIQWRDIDPGAQTERRGGAGPVGGLLGGKDPTGRFCRRASNVRRVSVHLSNQPRDRSFQVAAVDPGKYTAKDAGAKSLRLDDPDHPGVLGVQGLEP